MTTEGRTISAAPTAPPPAVRGTTWLAVIALFLAAANLRPAIAAVSPLVDEIRGDLQLSGVGIALLTTLPTLAMGLLAPAAAVAGRRWGLQRGVLVGLAVIGLATAARIGGQATWLQLSAATLAGCGIAIAQTLLPGVVKTRFADRPSFGTAVYTVGLGLGGAVAAGVSAPLSDLFSSWPAALASWSILAVVAIPLWSAASGALRLSSTSTVKGPSTTGLPWKSATAWRITALAAGNSALYYCELAWLAPLLHDDAGWSRSSAGLLLTVTIAVQVAAMLVVPVILGESRDRRIGLAVTSVLTAAGFFGFAFAAGTASWAWLALLGIGHGGLFTLVLALPAIAGRDVAAAGRLSAMAFFVGYAAAALAPVAVGALRDATGGFQLAFALLGAATAAMLIPIALLTPERLDVD